MSLTTKHTGWVSLAGLLFVSVMTSSKAYAGIFPSIPDAGWPFFTHSYSLNANKGNWNLTGRNGFSFDTTSDSYLGTDGFYKISAKFDKDTGDFQSGTLSIKGAIDSLGITSKNTVLFTADLSAFDFMADDGSGDTLAAFKTINLAGAICDMFGCTPAESIYLEFDGMFSNPADQIRKMTGIATTTIPLPAAAWLFGAGLVALGAAGRRKKTKIAA